MATVDVPRSKKREKSEPAKAPPKKSRAFRYGCYLTLLALIVGGYFAPWMLAHTPLGAWAVQSVLELDGSVSMGSTSLGWFSSVAAENVEIHDAAGEKVLELAALRTDKNLIGLLLDFSDLGEIQVDRPVLHVVAQEDDTNVEQVFARWWSSDTTGRVAVHLLINDGTVVIDDVPTSRQFRLENLAIDCTVSTSDNSIALVTSGTVADARQPGEFKILLKTKGNAESAVAHGQVDCTSNALPLEMIEPVARRLAERAGVGGRLSTRLAGAWGELAEGGETSVRGESLITGLVISAAALSSDRLELGRVEIPCHVVQNGELVQIEQLGIQCDLGQLSLSGSAKLSDFSAEKVLAALAHENYELKGHADLAQLARHLPHTLRIREGTEITSGNVDLTLSSRQQPDGMRWAGNVEAKNLAAQADGRALSWANPLAIEFETRETKDSLVLDRAVCTSSFLQIDAAGSIDELTASAEFDLARLVSELRQFSDLGGAQLAGRGQAKLAWKRLDNDQFKAQGEFQATGFQVVARGGQAWKEDKVLARLDLDGQLSANTLKRVERAELTVDAQGEQLQARLQEAVTDPATSAWPIQCSWRGDLADWSPRLESCLGLPGWALAGSGAMQSVLRCSSQAVEFEQVNADFTQFRAAGHGWFINEPAVNASTKGRWDIAKSRVDFAGGNMTAGKTTAAMSQGSLQKSAGGWTVEVDKARVDADLAQCSRWRQDPRQAPEWQVSGRLSGEGQLKLTDGVTTGRVEAAIENWQMLSLARPAKKGAAATDWRERQITLAALGSYEHAGELVKLDKVQIASDALRFDAGGTIPLAQQGGNIDLKGTAEYDWSQLGLLLKPYLGQAVQIAGRQTRAFAVRGRLTGSPMDSQSWHDVTGEGAVGWTSMDLYGLRVGPGEFAAQLAGGQLRGQPMDIEVSEGRFTFTPFARISPAPAELQLARGPLLTDVHLTPEMCARGLKFVAPILSEATVAEGRFSISADGGRIPLADPGAGDAAGRMTMKAQVKAGPVGQEFMLLVNEISSILQRGSLVTRNDQASALMSVDTSEIEFRLVNRRVYHRGLKFMAGTLPITTHGSVGLDETMSVVAEVPIQAKLFGKDLSLGALEGQTLQIPIEGTLSKPKLDRHILEQLAGKFLQNAARGALLDEVNKQLDKLLPKP